MVLANDGRTISIVVTSKNDPKLFQCLRSTEELGAARNIELSLVLNGSETDYVSRVEGVVRGIALPVRLTRLDPGGTVSMARNTGARASRGDFILFVDSDCTFDNGYGRALRDAIGTSEVVNGKVIFEPRPTLFSRLNCRLREISYDDLYRDYSYTPNLLMSRDTFEHLGGFDAALAFGEDFELSQRCHLAGFRARRHDSLVLRHWDDETWRKTVRAWFKYGIGSAYRFRRHCRISGQSILSFRGHLYELPSRRDDSLVYRVFALFYWVVINAGFVFGLVKWRDSDVSPLTFDANQTNDRGAVNQ